MTVAKLFDAMALVQELSAIEGMPPAQAAEVAEELQADLAAYAREWDAWAREARTCPTCGAPVGQTEVVA
jgi:NADH pyrophosphatase NudC (nudix superfamily)